MAVLHLGTHPDFGIFGGRQRVALSLPVEVCSQGILVICRAHPKTPLLDFPRAAAAHLGVSKEGASQNREDQNFNRGDHIQETSFLSEVDQSREHLGSLIVLCQHQNDLVSDFSVHSGSSGQFGDQTFHFDNSSIHG